MKIAGSKGKGYRAKDHASTNQNSAQNSNPTCGPRESGSHLVSTSGIGSTPKDSVSTTRSFGQNYNADGTASGPCGFSSLPVLGS